jgi:hypothetical protein
VLLTVDAERAVAIAALWPHAVVAAVHVEDWAHFSEQRAAFEGVVSASVASDRFVSLPRGVAVPVGAVPGAVTAQ